MTMPALDTLTTPLSVDDAQAAIYAAIAARGLSTTTWKPGAVVRTILFAVALLAAALSQMQAKLARLGFLVLSAGDWLAQVALYQYGVTRDEGSFATGIVTLTNAGGGVFSLGIGDLAVSSSTNGKSYRNTEAFTLNALDAVDVAIQAVELGAESSAEIGEVDTMVTSLLGVTCSNAAALVGNDAEDDAALIARCEAKTGSLSPNGPKDAYRFFATSTTRADGTSIGVNRVRADADGDGNVTVYVATPSGTVPGPDITILQAAIEENAEPIAVTATVTSAAPHTIAVTYTAWIDSATGLSISDAQAAIQAALIAFITSRPIGGDELPAESTGRVYRSMIETEIGAANPKTLRVTVTAPAADVDITTNEAPVIGVITPTINLVAGGS